MTYWTMDEADGIPAVTLCESCALEATNVGCSLFGLGPFATMQEAAAVLDALTATFGGAIGFDFQSSEVGRCEECEPVEVKSA